MILVVLTLLLGACADAIEAQCHDAVDDDNDGLLDCADDDCTYADECSCFDRALAGETGATEDSDTACDFDATATCWDADCFQ